MVMMINNCQDIKIGNLMKLFHQEETIIDPIIIIGNPKIIIFRLEEIIIQVIIIDHDLMSFNQEEASVRLIEIDFLIKITIINLPDNKYLREPQ